MASLTNQSMFEALFDRRLRPTGAFLEELKAAGYDVRDPQTKYPTDVWTTCLAIARRHRFAELSEADAFRHLGREFTTGFLETIVGLFIGAALPFLSGESFLNRLASYFRMGREDSGLTFDIVERGTQSARIVVHNPAAVPGSFVAGMIEIGFERMGKAVSVDVQQQSATSYELLVRWQ